MKHFTLICAYVVHDPPASPPSFCNIFIFRQRRARKRFWNKDIYLAKIWVIQDSPSKSFMWSNSCNMIIGLYFWTRSLFQLILLREQNTRTSVGSATVSTTLFAIERVSYLPGETICSPRNVVNETVKARETPTNWQIRFFHGVSRNRGESGAERFSRRSSISDLLTLLSSHFLSRTFF